MRRAFLLVGIYCSSSSVWGWSLIPIKDQRWVVRSMSTLSIYTPKNEDQEVLSDFDVSMDQLQSFCDLYKLETSPIDTKETLIQKLSDYASQQAQQSTDATFYFSSPQPASKKTREIESTTTPDSKPMPGMLASGGLPTRINEEGQTVVTTYSSTDPNDLTGFGAHSRPGDAMSGMASTLGTEAVGSNANRIESTGGLTSNVSNTNSKESVEEARQIITSLVAQLLLMTGAPGFTEDFLDDVTPYDHSEEHVQHQNPAQFVGFDPSKVPAEWLTKSSSALRMNNGQILKEVIREYELQAIGNDGIIQSNVDDPTKGGGHYREVQKVSAFLEGFKTAEQRRICRATASMLINTIVNEGQAGLDTLLSSMTRGEDDMQLNDALLEYLNDLVRSQQDKVDSQIQQQGKQTLTSGAINQDTSRLSHAPNHSKEQIEEIIDLNDPAVRTEAEQELEAQTLYQVNNSDNKLQSPAEQLLTLLKLLRERVKVEATFRSSEDHTRYLKILAACLHPSTVDVQLILMRSLGNSLEVGHVFVIPFFSIYTRLISFAVSRISGHGPIWRFVT